MGLTFSWGYLLDIITCNCKKPTLFLKEARLYLLLRSILQATLITQMPETLKKMALGNRLFWLNAYFKQKQCKNDSNKDIYSNTGCTSILP